jgi:hypothetical protein
MSKFSLFPKEEGSSSNKDRTEDEKTQYKRPEFILIDDRAGKSQYTYFGPDSSRKPDETFQFEKEEAFTSKNGLMPLRFLCLLGFIFCLVFGFGILIWTIALTCLATLSLFQNKNLNQGMKSFWKICINTMIAGFGFALGLLNPTLGLGLIALYFSISGDLVDNDLLRKVIRSSFNRV